MQGFWRKYSFEERERKIFAKSLALLILGMYLCIADGENETICLPSFQLLSLIFEPFGFHFFEFSLLQSLCLFFQRLFVGFNLLPNFFDYLRISVVFEYIFQFG